MSITVLYLNAAPEEVETGVCIPIEEAIAAVGGIKERTGVGNASTQVTNNRGPRRWYSRLSR